MNALTPTGGGPLVPSDFNAAMQLATMMSRGKLVPQHLRDSPGDCLMVVEQAARWGMSPFAVAQCTSVIQGKLMYEGKLVSAALHTSGALASRMEYAFSGEGEHRSITAIAVMAGEQKPRDITVALKDAKTSNGMWTKQPDQQLVYFATRAWARRHAPEVMLGVYSPEEFDEPRRDNFTGTTIDAKVETPPPPPPPIPESRRPTVTEWLKTLDAELAQAQTSAEVDAILARDDVQKAQDKLTNGAKDRLQGMLDAAIKRTAPPPASDEGPAWDDAPDDLATDADNLIALLGKQTRDSMPKFVDRDDYKQFVAKLSEAGRDDLMVKVREAATEAAAR